MNVMEYKKYLKIFLEYKAKCECTFHHCSFSLHVSLLACRCHMCSLDMDQGWDMSTSCTDSRTAGWMISSPQCSPTAQWLSNQPKPAPRLDTTKKCHADIVHLAISHMPCRLSLHSLCNHMINTYSLLRRLSYLDFITLRKMSKYVIVRPLYLLFYALKYFTFAFGDIHKIPIQCFVQ